MPDILGTDFGEKDLAAKLAEYQALAAANPDKKIDVASLMVSAMENQQRARVSAKARNWSYTLSTLLPPAGLFLAAYYWWWSDKEDAHSIALVCVALTVFIVAATLIFFDVLIQSVATPAQIQGIENINVQQVQQELQ